MDLFSRPPTQTIRVTLSPTPSWCIKTTALQSAICPLAPPPPPSTPVASSSSLLEPASQSPSPSTLVIAQGSKIFVNLALDANVPPPPEGSEDAIQKAMVGEGGVIDDENPGWFVPVVVSEPRSDIDKAGKPSTVFDAVFNKSLKSRALKDIAFKTFIEELAFQRIEDQYTLQLSRTAIGRPNIRSKGKLDPRTVLIPVDLFPENHPERVAFAKKEGSGKKPLIQEISIGEEKKPKGILKPSKSGNEQEEQERKAKISIVPQENEQPVFEWTEDDERVVLRIEVPRLTHAEIPASTLDVEPSRLILTIPPFYSLDLNIDLPDAQMPVVYGSRGGDVSKLKRLIRERKEKAFDVEGTKAEWRVGDGVVVVTI